MLSSGWFKNNFPVLAKYLLGAKTAESPTQTGASETGSTGTSETSSVNQRGAQGASMQEAHSKTAIETRKDANPQKTEMHPIASLIIPIKAPNSGAPAPNSGAPAPNSGAPAPNSGAPAPNSGAPFSIFTSIATVLVNLTETLTKKSPEEEGAKKQLTDAKPQTDEIINNKSTKPPEDIKARARFNPGEENTSDGPIQDKRSEWEKKKDEFMKKAEAEAVRRSQAIEASKQSTQQAREEFWSKHDTFGFENPDLYARDHKLSQKELEANTIALATSKTSDKSAVGKSPIGGYDKEQESLSLRERFYNKTINRWDRYVNPTHGKEEPKPLKPLSPENFNAQSARTLIHRPITPTSALEHAQESQKTNPTKFRPQTMKARALTPVQASESRGQNQPEKGGGVKFALAPKTGGGETKTKESATKPKVRFADYTKNGSNHNLKVRRTNNAEQGKENTVPNQR